MALLKENLGSSRSLLDIMCGSSSGSLPSLEISVATTEISI